MFFPLNLWGGRRRSADRLRLSVVTSGIINGWPDRSTCPVRLCPGFMEKISFIISGVKPRWFVRLSLCLSLSSSCTQQQSIGRSSIILSSTKSRISCGSSDKYRASPTVLTIDSKLLISLMSLVMAPYLHTFHPGIISAIAR